MLLLLVEQIFLSVASKRREDVQSLVSQQESAPFHLHGVAKLII